MQAASEAAIWILNQPREQLLTLRVVVTFNSAGCVLVPSNN